MSSYYTQSELDVIGFKSIGKNVLISKKASIYSPSKISIGHDVRIDDFCILSGLIIIENYIHIASYSSLFGGSDGIHMEDFSGLSSRVSIYAVSDDYSGKSLTNPMTSDNFKTLNRGKVIISRHVIIGSNSIVLPNVKINAGVAVGAFSLVNKDLDAWGIYVGSPARRVKERSKELLVLETSFMNDILAK